jgi:hypothetical protein
MRPAPPPPVHGGLPGATLQPYRPSPLAPRPNPRLSLSRPHAGNAGVTVTAQPALPRSWPFKGTLQPVFQAHLTIDFTHVDQSAYNISKVHIEDRPTFSNEIKAQFSQKGMDIGHGNDWQHMRFRIQNAITQTGTIGAAAVFLSGELGGVTVHPTIAAVEAATLAYAKQEHDRDMLDVLSSEVASDNRSRGSQGRGLREQWLSVRDNDDELASNYFHSMYAVGSSTYNENYDRDFSGAWGSIPKRYKKRYPRATSPDRWEKERKQIKKKRKREESLSSS